MKLFLLLSLLLASCATSSEKAKYQVEKNAPKFGNSRAYVESPADVLMAARAALDEISRESEPAAAGAVRGDEERVETGWVYSQSKDKYVEYKFNGTPRRKPLRIRRKYRYDVTPSLSGSQVVMQVEEELMKIDLKTGEENGWSAVNADTQAFEMMARRLTEKLRHQ